MNSFIRYQKAFRESNDSKNYSNSTTYPCYLAANLADDGLAAIPPMELADACYLWVANYNILASSRTHAPDEYPLPVAGFH